MRYISHAGYVVRLAVSRRNTLTEAWQFFARSALYLLKTVR